MLGRDDRRELVGTFMQELAEGKEHTRALGQRRVSPLFGRRGGLGDGDIDLAAAGKVHFGAVLTRGRVVDGGGATGGSGGPATIDPV